MQYEWKMLILMILATTVVTIMIMITIITAIVIKIVTTTAKRIRIRFTAMNIAQSTTHRSHFTQPPELLSNQRNFSER